MVATPDPTASAERARYRVGSHYGIHVYEGNRPVATFHDAGEAASFVAVANAATHNAVPDPMVEALVPESAHEWAKGHYIAFADFSDPDADKHVGFGAREALSTAEETLLRRFYDAPGVGPERVVAGVNTILAARAAAPDALRVKLEALAAKWERRHNEQHRGQGGWPDPAECPDCADVRDLRALLEEGQIDRD
jgi:hypothetical protein